jgi:acetyl-CoA acetyltransferase
LSLEGYGFCRKGEGGPFAAQTRLGHAGSIPINTGGGELSSYYMWGMTPVSEAIIQARGEGGERQSPRHDVVLASCQTRNLSTHSVLVLGISP